MFYLSHRILHNPKFYWVHKFHHEYNVTITYAAEYAHPIEHILVNLIPATLGSKLLALIYPVHIFTIIIWITYRLMVAFDNHSGYAWNWAQSHIFPFSAGVKYHDFHHKANVGNYGGILSIIDILCGTNEFYE
jgi:sterol desaturase/sphingolipid hydroxylase (fatty acid hydroxylase superfamily)